MEWYVPIAILPGIGMLILSTSNILISLNDEIRELTGNKKFHLVVSSKMGQLKRLNYALIFQYLSAFLFVAGGVVGELTKSDQLIVYTILIGVILLMVSIILLIRYSLKSLNIRQDHLSI